MNNKYNLDFYIVTECMNNYLDLLEDSYTNEYKAFVGNRIAIEELKQDKYLLDNIVNQYVRTGKYQEAFNTLMVNTMYGMFISVVMENNGDMGYIIDYVDSVDEELLINDVTEFFDTIK